MLLATGSADLLALSFPLRRRPIELPQREPTGLGAAQALLTVLAKETGATAFMMVPDLIGRRMAPTLWGLPDRPVRMDPSATTIQMQSMHANAGGKCYLAGLSEEELLEWVRGEMPKLYSPCSWVRRRAIPSFASSFQAAHIIAAVCFCISFGR